MKLATICRRIRDNDVNLKKVELEGYNTQKIDKVLGELHRRTSTSKNLHVQELVVRHSQLAVESLTTLLKHFCQRAPPNTTTTSDEREILRSPLRTLMLCLHEVGYDIPADDLAFGLFHGMATDNPPGLADLDSLSMCVGGMNEKSLDALQLALQSKSTLLGQLDLTNGHWVTDAAVAKICEGVRCKNTTTSNLELLYLSGNVIGNTGARHLATLLQTNKSLVVLRLDSNDIGDEGAVALATAMEQHNDTLRVLSLESNHIGNAGVTALARAMTINMALRHLSIKRNPPVTYVGEQFLVESVAQMKGLQQLEFGPMQHTANFKRMANSMESNRSMHDIRYVLREETFLNPEELEEFPAHMQPDPGLLMCFKMNLGAEYAEIDIPDIKFQMMAKYQPYIMFLCAMNKVGIRPLLFQTDETGDHPSPPPLGLWTHILKGNVPSIIFQVLREKPDLLAWVTAARDQK